MISIEELDLVDFQTHKKTTIKFSPHFNVIVGSTRSGKSSVVRALDFLLYNNWYEDYIRIGAGKTTITARLSNGLTIVREKGKASKIILKKGKEEQRFEAFGTSLPSEVVSALGTPPIDIGGKDPIFANIANQDDPLFLLYATGTDRTKILSRLSGLHWLDYALKDLNTDRRTQSAEIQLLQDANTKLLDKLKTFKSLPSLRTQLDNEKNRLSSVKKVNAVLQQGKHLNARTQAWKVSYQEIQSLKTIDFPSEISRLEKIIYLQSEILQPLQDYYRKLSTTDQSLHNMSKHLDDLRASQEEIQKQIAEESSKVPVCETCGQEIKQIA